MAFGSVVRVGSVAFMGSSLTAFSGHVGVWGERPFDNCRDLQRLEIRPGRGFDPLHLVGHAPGACCFRGSLGITEDLFHDLLRGSRTPIVITADAGQITGGRCSSASEQPKGDRWLMTWPNTAEIGDAAVGSVDLSGLLQGGLHSTLENSIWLETVTLPT
jgi:hypothetical protein